MLYYILAQFVTGTSYAQKWEVMGEIKIISPITSHFWTDMCLELTILSCNSTDTSSQTLIRLHRHNALLYSTYILRSTRITRLRSRNRRYSILPERKHLAWVPSLLWLSKHSNFRLTAFESVRTVRLTKLPGWQNCQVDKSVQCSHWWS